MYTRLFHIPDYSFFLFGPRGTGKTTWLREVLPSSHWKNLLLDSDYLPLLADPSLFSREVEALPPGSWVVLDEVQKIPSLLNEIHNLISLHGKKYKFAMSGSSARKLRRLNSNLLAGRALDKKVFPLTYGELQSDFQLSEILQFGSLPIVLDNFHFASEILSTYVGTYLKQEIQQEALVNDIAAFHRFLRVAGIMNGEIVSMSALARDASISRPAAERYFEILIDTLIGFRLPGWQPRLKVRERAAPKFYLFDTGVVRACSDRIRQPVSDLEIGKLLETYILHELRAVNEYQNLHGEFFYWNSGAREVDFIWKSGDATVAVEVKAGKVWRSQASKALREFNEHLPSVRCFGVYQGSTRLLDGGITIMPIEDFLAELHNGRILK